MLLGLKDISCPLVSNFFSVRESLIKMGDRLGKINWHLHFLDMYMYCNNSEKMHSKELSKNAQKRAKMQTRLHGCSV